MLGVQPAGSLDRPVTAALVELLAQHAAQYASIAADAVVV
jgi:hypothetical protein